MPACRKRILLALIPLLLTAHLVADDNLTALDRYVAAPDPAYACVLRDTIKSLGQTTYVLELTSQSWLTSKEVDRPLWKHLAHHRPPRRRQIIARPHDDLRRRQRPPRPQI